MLARAICRKEDQSNGFVRITSWVGVVGGWVQVVGQEVRKLWRRKECAWA